jgi:hypothetical protein
MKMIKTASASAPVNTLNATASASTTINGLPNWRRKIANPLADPRRTDEACLVLFVSTSARPEPTDRITSAALKWCQGSCSPILLVFYHWNGNGCIDENWLRLLTYDVAKDFLVQPEAVLSTIPLSTCSVTTLSALFGQAAERTIGNIVIPLARQVDPTDTGCYAVIWRMTEASAPEFVPVCGVAVGHVTPDKFKKYIRFAHEKAGRLSEYPDHILSFESSDEGNSRVGDPLNPKYPGAVRMDLDRIIISTSGFGWKFDELACLLIGRELNLLTQTQLSRAVSLSDNDHAWRYFTHAGVLPLP